MNLNYQAIALDVDGTLIKEGSYQLSPRVKLAIQQAAKRIPVIFCTGRSISEMLPMLEDLQIPRQYMALTGGSEIFSPQGEIIKTTSVPHNVITNFASNFANDGITFHYQQNGHWSPDLKSTPVRAFGFIINGEKQANLYYQKARTHSQDLDISLASDSSAPDNFMIYATSQESSKGRALEFILERLKIDLKKTIAIGDMYNDISMLKIAGLPIAMGQAPSQVKSFAKLITSSIDHDGAAQAIEDLLF